MFRKIAQSAAQAATKAVMTARQVSVSHPRLFSAPTVTPHPHFSLAKQALAKISPAHRMAVLHSDIAGTLASPHCTEPLLAMDTVFRRHGIVLTLEELTGPMGKSKPEHIQELIDSKKLNLKLENVFNEFLEELDKVIHRGSTLTPYAVELLQFAKEANILTSVTSGYNEKHAKIALAELTKYHQFNAMTTADQIPNSSRCKLIHANMTKLGLSIVDTHRTIFFTDAVSDIQSVRDGRNSYQPYTIGVADFSTHNQFLSPEQASKASQDELARKREHTTKLLYNAGAHLVIRNMSEGPLAIVSASHALSQGNFPSVTKRLELPTIPGVQATTSPRLR